MNFSFETKSLFNQMNNIVKNKKITLLDLNASLAVAIPRVDYYISYKAAINSISYTDVLESDFAGGLKFILKDYYERGRLGEYGDTTDISSYTFRLDALKLDYHWIPKNACTFFKRVLAEQQDPEVMKSVTPGHFHESMNSFYSVTMKEYLRADKNYIKVCIVRDPIERFVSCYVDKFLKPIADNTPLEGFIFSIIDNYYKKSSIIADPNVRSLTFSEFLELAINTPLYATNEHWRSQSSFLEGISFDKFLLQNKALDWFIDNGYASVKYRDKRANSSIGKQYTYSNVGGELASLLPMDIKLESIVDYNQFVDSTAYQLLSKFYKKDLDLVKLAE